MNHNVLSAWDFFRDVMHLVWKRRYVILLRWPTMLWKLTEELCRCCVLTENRMCRSVMHRPVVCVIRRKKRRKILRLQERHFLRCRMIFPTGPGMYPGGLILLFLVSIRKKGWKNMKNICLWSRMKIWSWSLSLLIFMDRIFITDAAFAWGQMEGRKK